MTTIQLPKPFPSHPSLPQIFTSTTPPPTLVVQGAEALLYKTHFLTPSTPAALKVRPPKPYRHQILDQRLTKQRVLAEARVLVKLSGLRGEGVRVPGVLAVEWDVSKGGAWLMMEWVEGRSVKQILREWDAWVKGVQGGQEERERGEMEVRALLRRVGRAVGLLHCKGRVVHGDLTSSNLMVRTGEDDREGLTVEEGGRPGFDGEIVLIDFGLATQSIQDEDRSVDLYVLERAFGSTHPRQEAWFDEEVLRSQEGYAGAWKGSKVVLKRLEEVRLRGRKRSMVG